MSFFGAVFAIFLYVWHLFLYWLSIFAAPVEEPEMFWIIIPVWINWFFTEFFQEKYGTSFGNAISNGAIAILASIDWTRYMYRLFVEGVITRLTIGVIFKFLVSLAVFVYGAYIIILSIKTNKIAHFIGKIRWVTYVLIMFTPIVYNVIKVEFDTMMAIILFFPIYYWIIEILDRITPQPEVFRKDK